MRGKKERNRKKGKVIEEETKKEKKGKGKILHYPASRIPLHSRASEIHLLVYVYVIIFYFVFSFL